MVSEDRSVWRPTPEEATDVVTAAAAGALHGLLDAPGPAPGDGDPLPPLWNWLAFLPQAPQHELGVDGHPRTGGFLPPVGEGRRRMFASAEASFGPEPWRIGVPVRRHGEVVGVEHKSGRSGDLTFVTVQHDFDADGRRVAAQQQHIVYRHPAPGAPAEATPADPEATEKWTWEEHLPTDPTVLFRFSALTYNAHRIHYDRPYATAVEGYPGLVVQGPLQAVALAELCRRHLPQRRLAAFRFRAVRPAFDGPRLRLCGRLDDAGAVTLVAIDGEGHVTTRATAVLA